MQTLRQVEGYGTVEVVSDLVGQIQQIIKSSGMTYERIGELANVHPKTISRWASLETKSPQLMKVAAVAEACGFTLTFIPTQADRRH